MTRAKNSFGPRKTEIVNQSLRDKLQRMREVLAVWKKSGRRGNEFWPRSLVELRNWDEPENGLHRWASKSVDAKSGKNSELIDEFWELQQAVALVPVRDEDSPELRRLKKENVKLLVQNTALINEIMDYRDEIVRMDPNNSFLRSTPFPPKLPF